MEKIESFTNKEKEKKKKKKTLDQLFDVKAPPRTESKNKKCPKGYKVCMCNPKKPKCKKKSKSKY